MKAHTVDGREVELDHEEVLRIASSVQLGNDEEFYKKVEERNHHYHLKAKENIRRIAERHGFTDIVGTEEEYKDLITACLQSDCDDIGDLIVEITEERIAYHHKKIYSE